MIQFQLDAPRKNQDLKVFIATATNRRSVKWTNKQISYDEFVDLLREPRRTPESFAEYKAMPRTQQQDAKDVGGFVGGSLKEGRRKAEAVLHRSMICLDFDSLKMPIQEFIGELQLLFLCEFLLYTTHSHSDQSPKARVIFPLARTVSPEEYEATARQLASKIGFDQIDLTTFQPERMMFWPSASKDAEYVFHQQEGKWLDPDTILAEYLDWRDTSFWPGVNVEMDRIKGTIDKQQDPLTKKGLVGAYCREYPITELLHTVLKDVYSPTQQEDRWTYTKGSAAGGLVVYEDKFAYSHHATDPISGQLANAFDLVRIHLFGERDEEAKPKTPVNRLPSFRAMSEYVTEDEAVRLRLVKERDTAIEGDLDFDLEEDAEEATQDNEWMKQLSMDNFGKVDPTVRNIRLIIENHKLLEGKIAHNLFSNRILVTGELPWDKDFEGERDWTDVDRAGLEEFVETKFGVSNIRKTDSAFALAADSNSFHPVREYLNSLTWDGVKRVPTLFADYLGAEPSPYLEEVSKIHLTAAVARIFKPGVKYDHLLSLQGPQGIGKSTLIRILASNEWFNDSIETINGKETFELLQGSWLIELGEMNATRKADKDQFKQFLTKTVDIYRVAYGRFTSRFPRQCIFWGTGNDIEFLRDGTGERRYFPVKCSVILPMKDVFEDLPKERDQIWAEALHYWKHGQRLYLTPKMEQIANEIRDQHKELNPKAGLIREWLEKSVPADWNSRNLEERMEFWKGFDSELFEVESQELVPRDRVCALEVWCELYERRKGDIRIIDSKEINEILSLTEGWEGPQRLRFGSEYGVQRGFVYEED
ncbi:MAG: hypothetical protein GX763_09615 [Clostridiaceae bacterium]|nr:hypothetical protein [Clostridiaceae bacterium]